MAWFYLNHIIISHLPFKFPFISKKVLLFYYESAITMNHYIFSTPLGFAAIVFENSPFRLHKILLPEPDKNKLLKRIPSDSKETRRPDNNINKIKTLISDYLNGTPVTPPFDALFMDHLTPLQKSVLKAVYNIPYGQTRSYGDIAKAIGKPKAARFVGTTMANNPFPILIPCHRVIRSDGSFGLFGGGEDLKARLIWMEKAVMSDE